MTRIISGKFRGKIIKAPGKLTARPTTDFAKESLFNILNNHFYFDEVKALDLFTGTGNLSYELASRGCEDIIAVDQSKLAVRFISETASKLGFDGLQVVQSDALEYVKRDYHQYDLIIADPPYDYDKHLELVEQIFFKRLLKEEGMLVVEHSEDTDLSALEHFFEHRRYGKVHFSFFLLASETE